MSDTLERTGTIESIDASGQSASGTAPADGFIVVAIEANPTNRYVEVSFRMNGQYVGKMTAADNHVPNVISTGAQITTIPISKGTSWQISWNVPNNNNEVRLWVFPR